MEQLLLLLVSTCWCLALGSPIAHFDEVVDQGFIGDVAGGLVLAVADDEQQSVAVLNMGDEKIVEMEVDQGENYRYDTRYYKDGGGYQWGYDSYNVPEGDAQHFRHEIKRPDGTVLGRYGYRDPNGKLRVTNYVSDTDGFQVLQPGVLVQLESVVDNENVQGNDVRLRSGLVVDEPEAEVPIVHAVLPPGARDLQNGENSYGYFLPLTN